MNTPTNITIYDGKANSSTPNAIHSRLQKFTINQLAFGRGSTIINNQTPNDRPLSNAQEGTFTVESIATDRSNLGKQPELQNILDRNKIRRRANYSETINGELPESEYYLTPPQA